MSNRDNNELRGQSGLSSGLSGDFDNWADVFDSLAKSERDSTKVSPPLLIRPDARAYPNRPDYLLRLAQKNGLRGVLQLATVLRTTRGVLARLPAGALNKLTRGRPVEEVIAQQGAEWARSKYKGEAYKLEARVCPRCIREDLPMSPHFNLALPVLCPSHRIMVLDRCAQCSRTLTYLRTRVERCVCGFNLGDATLLAPPGWLNVLYALFAPWHLQELERDDFPRIVERDQRAGRLIRLILSPAEEFVGRSLRVGGRVTQDDLPALEALTVNWEVAFEAALGAHLVRLRPQARPYFLRRFVTHGSLLLAASVQRAAKGPVLRPLLAESISPGGGTPKPARMSLSPRPMVSSLEMLDLDGAAALLGCSSGIVRRLVRHQYVPAVMLTNNASCARFCAHGLSQWLDSLKGMACPLPAGVGDTIALADVPCNDRKGRVLLTWIRVFQEVTAGRVPVFEVGKSRGLSGLHVLGSDAARYRARLRQSKQASQETE